MLEKLRDFASQTPLFPADISGWDLLNSNLLIAAVAGAYTLVAAIRAGNESKKLEQVASQSTFEDQQAEVDASDLAKVSGNKTFDEGANLISDIKSWVETVASKANGHFKRTYNKITRYDYVQLVQAMATRDLREKPETVKLLVEAFSIWRKYKNGRVEVPQPILDRLREIRKALGELKPTK